MAKIIAKAKLILLGILLIALFLRLWQIDLNPVSLFGDELDLGYQAYSILKTGRDYYGNFMPLHFHSLAEWRTPLYLYSAVPTVAIFGISPLGVRLPAIIFGVLGIWGIYLLVKEISKEGKLGLLAALVLTFSPWHIQYSRGGFEVTQLLCFLLFGLYFFFKSLNKGKWLFVSVIFLTLTPWVYSTAKLFTPFIMVTLFILYRKEILALSKKYLIAAAVAGLIIGTPIAVSTIVGGGAQRFNYLSVFSNPVIEPEVGFKRLEDAKTRGDDTLGMQPTVIDRFFHNKVTFWGKNIINNVFESFSTEFLFMKGDPNLRHSVGIGELYKVEVIPLLLGLTFFLLAFKDRKVKLFIIAWFVLGIFPASITRDGGKHATRLILTLPIYAFLISYGLYKGAQLLKGRTQKLVILGYVLAFLFSFVMYQHEYWVHYPWNSERWWHSGFKESIAAIKENEKDYDRVFISMAGEPAWIFFAGWYPYPPQKWQDGFPFKNIYVKGFGNISYLDKYYFGIPNEGGKTIYELPSIISSKDLYLAVAKEVPGNLILDPARTPNGLKLIKAIPYPSGEPAFYLFSGMNEKN